MPPDNFHPLVLVLSSEGFQSHLLLITMTTLQIFEGDESHLHPGYTIPISTPLHLEIDLAFP